ncbi:hypothetical protein EBR43_10520, partial [bacterium]|nr:hypothetical protein [bacterium]
AKNNNTTINDILKANPQITNRDLIYAGAKLSIPSVQAATTSVDNQPNLSAVRSEAEIDQEINANAAAAEADILANSEQILTDDQIEDEINRSVDEAKAQEGEPYNGDIEDYANGGYGGASQDEYNALTSAIGGGLGTKSLNINGSSKGPIATGKGNSLGPFLRDYQHASKLFLGGQLPDGQQGLMPKTGFLFHVVFDLNKEVVRDFSLAELGLMVKAASLPKFTMEVKMQNAYNRANYTQTKIKYDPVTISFHDDSSNVVRDFWFSYFNYYYRDSDYEEPLYQINHRYNSRSATEWGYTPKKKSNSEFLNSIRIFSLHQKKFAEYVLVNPIIRNFKHGEHKYEDPSGLMSHEMTIDYETVLYYSGSISEDTVKGFGTIHYDRTPSPNLEKESNLVGPGSATDRSSLGSNKLPGSALGSVLGLPGSNSVNKPPAKDWITSIGDSVFGENSFIGSKIFVPVAKAVVYNATSKATIAINRTIQQSVAKVKGALGPIGGAIPGISLGSISGIPNIGSYITNAGPGIVTNVLKKLPTFPLSTDENNSTTVVVAQTANVPNTQPTTVPTQGTPNSQNLSNLTKSEIDSQIRLTMLSITTTQKQINKHQDQIAMASKNFKFFSSQIDKNLYNGMSVDDPELKKLQSYLSQQLEIKSLNENQMILANQQLLDLQKTKQNLVKEIIKK